MNRKPQGKMEKRAAEACEDYTRNGGGSFTVDWKKSATWGNCPRIDYRGEKAAYASGCGYDKLSAVLVEYLGWLAPEGQRLSGSGAGVRTVQDNLRVFGWELVHDYDGNREDGFTLKKIQP